MKAFSVIQQQINNLKERHEDQVEIHGRLNQIDMLSGEGNILRQEIYQLKGEIKALEWVINDHIDEL